MGYCKCLIENAKFAFLRKDEEKLGAETDKAPTRAQTSRVSIPTHPLRAAKGRGWVGSETREAPEKAILSRRTSLFFPNSDGVSSALASHPNHDGDFPVRLLANHLVNAADAKADDIALRPIKPFGQIVELGPLFVVEPGGDGLDGNHNEGSLTAEEGRPAGTGGRVCLLWALRPPEREGRDGGRLFPPGPPSAPGHQTDMPWPIDCFGVKSIRVFSRAISRTRAFSR